MVFHFHFNSNLLSCECALHNAYLTSHTHTYTHTCVQADSESNVCATHTFSSLCVQLNFQLAAVHFTNFIFRHIFFDINIEGCLGKLPDAHCTSKRKHQKLNQNLGLRITLPTTKLFQQFFFFLCCAKNHSFFPKKYKSTVYVFSSC